ncbi:hypothetical protein [Amycolatopsis samaneae]|uniref:Secreted protein n=1 Tax=Amycolatopsis samaneae TaxID=664691 RepID=A0ABW5G7L8_9PSEU
MNTLVLIGTAVAVPATSVRAALALPVFVALAKTLAGHRTLVRAPALPFPAVTGAGAHVLTSRAPTAATPAWTPRSRGRSAGGAGHLRHGGSRRSRVLRLVLVGAALSVDHEKDSGRSLSHREP